MGAIRDYYDEVVRIREAVHDVHREHKPWDPAPDFDHDEYDAAMVSAFGNSGGRDLRAAAMLAAKDTDIRQRVEAVDAVLVEFVNHAYTNAGTDAWRKITFAMRDSLRRLEPFVEPNPATQGKGKSKAKPRGNRADKTTATDNAVNLIEGDPDLYAKATLKELADAVGVDKSLFSQPENRRRIRQAQARAQKNVRNPTKGFGRDGDWEAYDDQYGDSRLNHDEWREEMIDDIDDG